MVDLSKISEAVQKFVKETAKVEGNKRQIDSKKNMTNWQNIFQDTKTV